MARVLAQHSRRWNLRWCENYHLSFSIKHGTTFHDGDNSCSRQIPITFREVFPVGRTLFEQVSWYGTKKGDHSSLNHHSSIGRDKKEAEKAAAGGWSYHAIVNAPNILSFARLVSGPAIAGLIIQGHVSTAVPLVLISGATDWLDGYLARRQGLTDNILGSYLDPLADKVLVGSVVCSMGYAGLMSPYVWILILGRDVCLIGGAFWARAHALNYAWPGLTKFFNISGTSSHAAPKAEPLYISKVNTVVQIALVSSCLVDSCIGWPGPSLITHVLEPATAVTTVWSLIAYIHAYRSGSIRLVVKS